jgi:hypothetical protein
VDVAQPVPGGHEGGGEVRLLEVHVEDVAHDPEVGAADLVDEADRVGDLDADAVLVAIDRLEHQPPADLLGVGDDLLHAAQEERLVLLACPAGAAVRQVRGPSVDGHDDERRVQLRPELEEDLDVVDGVADLRGVGVDQPAAVAGAHRRHRDPVTQRLACRVDHREGVQLEAVEAVAHRRVVALAQALAGHESGLDRESHHLRHPIERWQVR